MREGLVQWTLLQNLDYLATVLKFPIASKRGQEITTAHGRIDFILENFAREQLVVELETTLSDKSKLTYCFEQVLAYKQVSFVSRTSYCILYAKETHPSRYKEIEEFGIKNNVLIRTYPIEEVKGLYANTVERLSLSFGMALPKSSNYTVCYLRWINKLVKPFRDVGADYLNYSEAARYFSSSNSTNFKCYLRLATDFEIVSARPDSLLLTDIGKSYVANFNPDIDVASNLSAVNLTSEQKVILLRVLTNGTWTPHKVNVYWFLRYIEITNGNWIPNNKELDESHLSIANSLFGVNYKSRTMYEFLNFACNWCLDLDLAQRIRTGTDYDQVSLTSLGVEVNNIFSLDLLIKRSRLNLTFRYTA